MILFFIAFNSNLASFELAPSLHPGAPLRSALCAVHPGLCFRRHPLAPLRVRHHLEQAAARRESVTLMNSDLDADAHQAPRAYIVMSRTSRAHHNKPFTARKRERERERESAQAMYFFYRRRNRGLDCIVLHSIF